MRRDSLRSVVRLPGRHETIRAMLSVLLISAISWYFGADVGHAILLGCAITTIVVAAMVGTSTPERAESWLHRRADRGTGSRHDVAELSHSLHAGWGRVGVSAERRLFEIARRRLALDGLDLGDPNDREAIEQRIGPGPYRLLTRRDRRRAVSFRGVVRCVDALERVGARD